MVWGAMSSAGVGPLYFPRVTVNAMVYQETLENLMLSSAERLFGDAKFVFQQDSAPAHSAKSTAVWFADHHIDVLPWPSNSPDLNPIENLWGIVKKMASLCPSNLAELKTAIETTWASIKPEQCHLLISCMPRRIQAVIRDLTITWRQRERECLRTGTSARLTLAFPA